MVNASSLFIFISLRIIIAADSLSPQPPYEIGNKAIKEIIGISNKKSIIAGLIPIDFEIKKYVDILVK